MITENDSVESIQDIYKKYLRYQEELTPYLDSTEDMRSVRDSKIKVSDRKLEVIATNFKTLMTKKRGLMVLHTKLGLLYKQHKDCFPGSLFLITDQAKTIEVFLKEFEEMFEEDAPIEDKYFYYGALNFLQKCNSRKS